MESIKRNLFGIRLNHEQLKQDLSKILRKELEFQKQKWNFDFEALKHFDANDKLKCSKDEDFNNTNYKTALLPAFYHLQRVKKMNRTSFPFTSTK